MDLVGSELRASPDLYPLAYDPGQDQVGFIQLSQARYEAASFLDQRVVQAGDDGGWAPFAPVREAAAPLAGESDFIFHIGHVGSTLLARLLGLSPRIFSLREPGALRTFAQLDFDRPAAFDAQLAVFLKLWGRTYAAGQRTLVKATSFVGEMASRLLTVTPSARAILLTVAPEVYLATILGGPNSRVELRAQAPSRLERLRRRNGDPLWRLDAMSEGELCAMSWAAEVAGLVQAAEAFPNRILWLDFERFLAAPEEGLAAALTRLHGAAAASDVETMLASPLFGRYSKGLEHAYDAALRKAVLDQARRESRAEIRKGLAWLDRAAAEAPAVARSLARAAG